MKTTTISALALLGLTQPALANIDIQFDYSYDTSGFFSAHSDRQATLNAAAAVFESRLTDSLGAITSSGDNHFATSFFNPADPINGADINLSDQTVGANVLRVYVGSYNFSGSTVGMGGHGGYSCSGLGAFCTSATINRGQGNTTNPGAVDFAPWGGAITFDSDTNWNFSTTAPGSGQIDLYSVALHELGHQLGFGTADSFAAHVANGKFSGPATGVVSMSDKAHWATGTKGLVNGVSQDAAMTPSIAGGQRKYFTELDFDALRDTGWQVTPVPEPDTWAMFFAGLGLIGWVLRRRNR
jgi:hypothetical protein